MSVPPPGAVGTITRSGLATTTGPLTTTLRTKFDTRLLVPNATMASTKIDAHSGNALKEFKAVLALDAMPPKWRANAAFLDPLRGEDNRWVYHVGYVTPADHYFGVDASNQADITQFVNGYLYGVETGETRMVAGLEFRVYTNEKQRTWLHRGVKKYPYAIVITGAGDPAEFETFAQRLSAGS